MDLAIAFDQNFLTPFYVLLTSIFSNNANEELIFHVIASNISDLDKKDIADFINRNKASILFYSASDYLLPVSLLPLVGSYTLSTYHRLLFPHLVPHTVQKLLYIDTDTVVVNNLKELYQTDIGDLPIGAVIETFAPKRPELGINNKGSYFNSGVMLINVSQWKQLQLTERALDYLTTYPERIVWMDQDALNALLIDNYYPLDLRYNLTSEYTPKELPLHQLKLFLKDKVIIHYTSATVKKPWSALSKNRLRFVYYYYLKKSPKGFQKKYSDFSFSRAFLIKYFKIRLFEFIIGQPPLLNMWRQSKRLLKARRKLSK